MPDREIHLTATARERPEWLCNDANACMRRAGFSHVPKKPAEKHAQQRAYTIVSARRGRRLP
jgi:hypothetical protein